MNSGDMSGDTGRKAIECPQCGEQVFMRIPVLVPTEAGICVQDPSSLILGIRLHMRVGCRRLGRRSR